MLRPVLAAALLAATAVPASANATSPLAMCAHLEARMTVLSSEDQTGTTSYYEPVLKGSQLIRRLLMNGDDDHGSDSIDISLSSVKGVSRTNDVRFLATGVSSVYRTPHSYGNDYPPRQAP